MARNTLNILSLCSGVGGLDLGVELATGGAARVVCHVEREAFAAAILAARMEDKTVARAPVWSDVRTFDGKPWRGVVDCVVGGYPCQDFSYAGKRAGFAGSRGSVWFEVARIVAEVQPGIVFFENVAGHLTLGFSNVRRELEDLGYRVTAGLFTAEEVGAPHRRERLFILGVADAKLPFTERQRGHMRSGLWEEPIRSGEGGNAMDDTQSKRPQGIGAGVATARATGRNDGAALAHAGISPPNARPESVRARDDTDREPSGVVDVFHPGPRNRAEWERILRDRPDLAPAVEPRVRGMADGLASRLDRLRACGNGVVPLVAAYAFVSLFACLREE